MSQASPPTDPLPTNLNNDTDTAENVVPGAHASEGSTASTVPSEEQPEPGRSASAGGDAALSSPVPAPPARSGLLPWLLVPLLMLGVGFVGFRLGKTGTAPASTQGGFAGGAQGAGSGTAGAGTGSNRSGTGRSGSGSGQNAAGGTGTRAAGSAVVTPVRVSTVKSGTLSTERRLTGNVSAAQTVNVTSQTSGTVTSIFRNVGDSVGAGQTVLKLSNKNLVSGVQSAQNNLQTAQAQLYAQQAQMNANTASLQQAITAARASLTNAQASYDSLQQLYRVGAVAKAALDAQGVQVQAARNTLLNAQSSLETNRRTNSASLTAARLNVQKAQIAVSQAEDAAADVNVSAPFAGQITVMNATPGQFLNANAAAFTLISRLQQVKVSVPATEAASLPVGAALTFVVGQQKYPLKVIQNAGGSSDSVPITAKFTGDTAAQGTVGSVVYTAKVATGVLLPSTALQIGDSTTYVYTVEKGKAKQHLVTVLGQAGTQSVVSGVSAGASVVTEPPTGLLDGGLVTTRSAAARQGSSGTGGPPGGLP